MKKIKNQLKNEVNKSVLLPDIKEKIRNNVDFNNIQTQTDIDSSDKGVATLAKSKKITITALLILAAIIIASICVYFFGNNSPYNPTPPSIAGNVFVHISINPSVELTVDKNGLVTAQKGLNKDGVTLLYKKSLVGLTAEQAGAAIIDSAALYGYLNNTDSVKLNVIGNNAEQAEILCQSIKETLTPKLNNKKVVTPSDDETLVKEAQENGVSAEKWQLIKIAIDETGYSKSDLLKLSIEDILELIEDTEQLDAYLNEIEGDIVKYIDSAIESAENLITLLENVEGNDDDKLPESVKKSIREHCLYFDEELSEDLNELTIADIEDLIEELNDSISDFKESREEMAEDGDEASDILEDCLDGYKKWQNKYGK